jgi:hypothetical protein
MPRRPRWLVSNAGPQTGFDTTHPGGTHQPPRAQSPPSSRAALEVQEPRGSLTEERGCIKTMAIITYLNDLLAQFLAVISSILSALFAWSPTTFQ